MAAEIGKAFVQIMPSSRGMAKKLQSEFGDAGTQAGKKFGTEFDKASEKSSSGLDSFGTKAIIGAAAVGTAFFGLASAAGDLSAAVAANEQVLGDASTAVQDFAETGVESVGLSETAILNAATSFGQLGKVIGLTGDDLSTFSTDLVTLAADMAAFKNVTPTQALEDLQSAFAGQPEVLRKYGVFLDDATLKQAYFAETGERVTGTLTPQQRLIATNAELWRQTGDIQGQAAREADGFERSIANLKATVGNVAADFGAPIVGFASGLLSTITDGIGTLESWNEQTGGMLATGLAAGIGIAAAGSAAFGIGAKVKGAVDKFKDLSRAMQLTTGIVGGLSLAVAAGITIYGLMTQHSRDVAARTDEVSEAFRQATIDALAVAEGVEAASLALGKASLSPELEQSLGILGVQAADLGPLLLAIGEDGAGALQSLAEQAGVTETEAQILTDAIVNFGGRNSDVADSTNQLANAILNTLANSEEYVVHEDDAAQIAADLAEQYIGVAGALEDIYDEASPERQAQVAQEFLNSAVASSELGASLVEQAETQADATRASEDAFSVYEALLGIISALPPEEQAAALEAVGLADAQTDVAEATEEAKDELIKGARVMGDMEDAADRAESKVDAFSDALDRLIGVGINVREAERDLADGLVAIAESAVDADENMVSFHDVIDGTTQAGRDAAATIDDQISGILAYGEAQLEAGASVEGTAALMEGQADLLVSQVATAFGITEADARSYIEALGLTPESIETAVRLSDLEAKKDDLQLWVDDLGGVPPSIATAIEAATDEDSLERARQRLVSWAAQQNPTVFYRVMPRSSYGFGDRLTATPQAFGGVWSGNDPRLAVLGDAPWDEAVLTIGNPSNLRHQLEDPKILNPILRALPSMELSGAGSGSPLVGTLHVGDRRDIDPMMEALDELRWQARVAS